VSIGVLFLVVIPQLQLQVRHVAGRAPHWGQWLYDHLTPLLEAAAPPLSRYFGIALDIDSLRMYAGHLWDWVMAHLPGITQTDLPLPFSQIPLKMQGFVYFPYYSVGM
jgi:hypothetical protein